MTSSEEVVDQWLTPDACHRAVTLSRMVRTIVKTNTLVCFKRGFWEDYGKEIVIPASLSKFETRLKEERGIDHGKIFPSPDPAYLFNHNPVYCGLETLRITLRMEKERLKLCNKSGALFAVAHLYNAVQQTGLINGHWNALEMAISRQIGQLFSGALPTTHRKIYSRFFLRLGFPATAFARSYRSAPELARKCSTAMSKISDAEILKLNESAVALLAYLEGAGSAEKFLAAIELEHRKDGEQNMRNQPRTRLQTLAALNNWIPQLLSRSEVPYITLTRKCNILLERIRNAVKEESQLTYEFFGRDYTGMSPHMSILTVMDILVEAFSPSTILMREFVYKKGGKTPDLGYMLTTAARVIQEFLEEANQVMEVEPFEVPVRSPMSGNFVSSEMEEALYRF